MLVAPPGAGKTTLVPLALLDAPWRGDQRILMLEPRRLATRAAANRMAFLIGEQTGRTVGYRTRIDSATSAETRIEDVTEGLLVRRLQSDPGLDNVAAVILDEVHERSLESDLALALCLDLQRVLRPDLRLIAMSATADGARLSGLMDAEVIESFDGYQSGDSETVMAQVFAVWNALQRRGIKYSSITTTTPSKYASCQTVRFLDESIQNTQANCVDGSVLMASILRKIGIDVYLVMVPGHCFLAYMDGEGDDAGLIGLETTMLGQDNLKPLKDLPKLPAKLKQKELNASFKTFEAAIDAGLESLEEHMEAFDAGDDPNVQLISIEDARDLGIMPLASGKKKE